MVFIPSSSGRGPDAVKGAKASPERGMSSDVPPIRKMSLIASCSHLLCCNPCSHWERVCMYSAVLCHA